MLQSSCPSGNEDEEPVLEPPQVEDALEADEGADHAEDAGALEDASKN